MADGKEDVGPVEPHDAAGLGRVRAQPGLQPLERHGLHGHVPLGDDHPADRGVGLAVAAGIDEPCQRPVRQAQAGGALDLRIEQIDIVTQPGDLEALPGQRPVHDRRAVGIGHEACGRPARCRKGRVETGARFTRGEGLEVGRTAQRWHREAVGGHQRRLDLRLVVAREKALAGRWGDGERAEPRLEKRLRRVTRERPGHEGRPASRNERPARRQAGTQHSVATNDARTGQLEDREGGCVIVGRPARDIGPSHRRQASVAGSGRGTHRADLTRDQQAEPGSTGQNKGTRIAAPCRHWPDSVATSFQLGSRVPASREKVQTSVTSTILSGAPSMTAPSLSRVAVISFERKRTVT